MKVRPDQRLVVMADWGQPRARMRGVAGLVGELAKLAA
jgi:hypothetical protein